ncbi:macrophage colony-stimulating factor 1 isoform X1 [Choloepus didactylus]|uniref:macrophage colony-stimulating factor 1 isoform X1 n=1 Tax=Choloepus didactylus TaxID=27675 RepID=UPI00189E4F49|nr:macrophage colony-stimulating factor 1 isoform X1 [Choloepus didactylus]
MTARGAAGRCPPEIWLGPRMLLVCLLVSRSVTKDTSDHCSHLIGDGHLALLQKLIDSQMETSCQIAIQFVDREQLSDPVCYLKKAFLLMQDLMEYTLRFKDNTPNAMAIVKLQELSWQLKGCVTKAHEDQDKNKSCVRIFYETPLQLLEKVKNVFNETRNLLKKDWKLFSKNCNDSFAKCSSQDVVTKPDCNCLYPKTTPSSELASVSPHQPLAPSTAPMAGLTQADSAGTEGGPLLTREQPLRTVDPRSAKQRPPRSTCQSFEPPEKPGTEASPAAAPPRPHLSVRVPTPDVEDVLDSVLGTNWALEEASGEASESPVPQGTEVSPSGLGDGSIQAQTAGPSSALLLAPSPQSGSAKGQPPARGTGSSSPGEGPNRPTGLARSHTTGFSALPGDPQDPASLRSPSVHWQGPSSAPTRSTQRRLPRRHSWGNVLPLGELETKRSTRDRRSPTEPKGGRASEGADRPQARFNSVPLTDTGHERQHVGPSEPQLPGFVFRLLVPSIILVLLAVGGLLFYRRRWRSHREHQTVDSPMEQPEGSPLTQEEDTQVELPV